jgi:hypothetical protein
MKDRRWIRIGRMLPCLLLLLIAATVGCGGTSAAPNDEKQYSTQTGQDHGSVNFSFNSALPYNVFVGAWTHAVPPGSRGEGNDYPFVVLCQEGEVSLVSGNFGPSEWAYNANIMLFDPSGTYLGDYTLVFADASYAVDVDWVYVGWHFQRSGSQTSVTQYVKFVASPNLVDKRVTELVPGTWTPTGLLVGGDPTRYADTTMYMMYARVYAMDVPPTDQQLHAIYTQAATPDPAAWADWPLFDGAPADVSGNGRNLTVNGPVVRGVPGPKLP